MQTYDPEIVFAVINMIRNVALIVAVTAMVLGLFAMSRSWHSLWPLLALLLLSASRFIRD
jgi:membrane protein YdbS with pleckstrin-like domain